MVVVGTDSVPTVGPAEVATGTAVATVVAGSDATAVAVTGSLTAVPADVVVDVVRILAPSSQDSSRW